MKCKWQSAALLFTCAVCQAMEVENGNDNGECSSGGANRVIAPCRKRDLAAELFVGSAEVGHSNSILGVSLCWL